MESDSENESLDINPMVEAAMASSLNCDSENESLDIKPLVDAAMVSSLGDSDNESIDVKPMDFVDAAALSSCDGEDDKKPPNFIKAEMVSSLSQLPEKSRKKYESTYKFFMDWRKEKKMRSFTEDVLMTYFAELAAKFKCSTLWTHYSMLRTTLNIHQSVDIAKYFKLRAFLKRQSHGYQPRKAKTFTSIEINKFINEAPDAEYLITKVALIMGVMGACRGHELHQLKTSNLNDLGSAVLITIPNSRTKSVRKFTLTGRFYEIFKQYADLRPTSVQDSSFFLNYQKGKCTVQKVGINKFGAMGKQIAKYLKLPNPELYTGHCFHKSAATTLLDGGESGAMNGYGGWKFIPVAKDFIDKSMESQFVTKETPRFTEGRTNLASTSGTEVFENLDNETLQLNSTSSPKIILNNCSNITINIVDSNNK